MKILHIGGYAYYTDSLAKLQRESGHDVSVIGARDTVLLKLPIGELEDEKLLSKLAADKFDIIHFHLIESFFNLPPLASKLTSKEVKVPCLELLKASGAKLVYSSYDCDLKKRDEGNVRCSSCISSGDELSKHPFCKNDPAREVRYSRIASYFDHLFLCTAENHEVASKFASWSWLSLGIDLSSIPAPVPHEPDRDGVRILHIPTRPGEMQSAKIMEITERVKAQGYRFIYSAPETARSWTSAEALAAFNECDLYIEALGRHDAGPLGVMAMARGKSLISGNSDLAKNIWHQLSLSSTTHGTPENLADKLVAILKQRKCMRDFGKRGRLFVEKFHNAATVAQITHTDIPN